MGSSAFSWLLGRPLGSAKEGKSRKNESPEDKEFGVTEQLREFVCGFTVDTFKIFPLPPDEKHDSAIMTQSNRKDRKHETNLQKDLNQWQEKHAMLVLSSVKEIAKIRYILCPRYLNDNDFWKIYFLLVKKFVAPYELHAIQKARLEMMEMKDQESTDKNIIEVEMMSTKPLESASSPPSGD